MRDRVTADELLEDARRGDARAVERLVLLQVDWLKAGARRRLDRGQRLDLDSGDVVQDVVVQLLESGAMSTLRDEEHLRALLQRIMNNDLMDARRRRSRRRLDPQDLVDQSPSVTRPSQHAQRLERDQLVRRSLDGLPEEDRQLLVLRVWEQRSFGEIAERLGCTADAARMRLNRALARFADRAEDLLVDQ